jgi:tetratricopeptide (TPR) repeat protein
MKKILLVLCGLLISNLTAQADKLDSLFQLLEKKEDVFMLKKVVFIVQREAQKGNLEDVKRLEKLAVSFPALLPHIDNCYAIYYLSSSNIDTAFIYLRRAMLKEKENDFLQLFYQIYGNFGYALDQKDQIDSALYYYKKSLDYCISINDSLNLSNSYQNMGACYSKIGKFEIALEYSIKGLQIREKINNRILIASSLNNIASLLNKIKRFEDAIEYSKRNYELRKELKDSVGIISALNTIGVAYNGLQDEDKTRKYYQEALFLAEKLNNKKFIAMIANNIGNLEEEAENYEKALEYLQKSLAIKKEISPKSSIVITMSNVGNVLISLKKHQEAQKILSEALAISQEIKAKNDESIIYNYLARSFEMNNEPQQAILYYKKYIELKESLFNQDMAQQIADVKVQYETEKKEQQILLQQQEIENLALENTIQIQKRNTIFAMVGVIIIAMLLFYNRQRIINKTKQELVKSELLNAQQELAFKEKELMNYTENLISKSKTIKELQEQLIRQNPKPEIDENSSEDAFLQLLDQRILTQDDWVKYKIVFEQVYPNFFENITQKYGQLTDGEMRMLAFAKLQLNNKQVADILGINVESVKIARNRIRKKLNLEAGADLQSLV